MKYFVYLLLLITFISTLDASYIRSIRVGTYLNQMDAEDGLGNLREYFAEHENLQNLQDISEFELKARRSGNYYITLIEPFTDRETLQEVLDTLRLEYKDIYVTKLQEIPRDKTLEIAPIVNIQDEKSLPVTIKKPRQLEETQLEKTEVKEVKAETPRPKIQKPLELKNNTIVDIDAASTVNIWQIFSFILFAAIALLIWFLLKLKRENEEHINKELIYNEKLRQANQTIETKEEFLSHSSHELRTPMTAIMGLTHLVLENELPKFQREYIEKIQTSAEHLVNIVNDILDISKIEAGKLKIEKAEFNLNDILDYVLNIVSIQAKKNNVRIKLEVNDDIPAKLIGDSLRLGQILINLLGNSAKFTVDGEIKLEIKETNSFANNINLEFIVSDTGIGMTQKQIEKLFSSYMQADESTSRKFGGTGLGLSISKQLVEMMDGKIRVVSEKDVGTTFTFSIPFQLKDAQDKRHYRLPSKSFLNKRILIVDASNHNALSLIKAFSYFNYKCHAIPSFEEAVLESDMVFDIIIIHQDLLSKFAVKKIEDLKKSSNTDIKVVVLNELHSGFNSQTTKSTQIDAYFKTPFTQQSVLTLLVDLYVSNNLDSYSRKKTLKDKLSELPAKQLLVAEDNLLNHKVIDGLLANTSIETTYVVDGQEAVDLVRKGTHFDLILMDINMPKINGYEAAAEIRKNKEYDNIPIFALTADVMDEAIEKAFNSGMQGHISKPIIVDIFYKKIYDALNSSKVQITTPELTQNNKEALQEDLSVSMGLSRCNNDKKFYKSILMDFKTMYLNSAVTLENLCRNGHFKEARQKAMDIKDVALNIGAYNLCECAAAMEYEFEKGARSNWQELVSFYANSLEKLCTDIEKYIQTI